MMVDEKLVHSVVVVDHMDSSSSCVVELLGHKKVVVVEVLMLDRVDVVGVE
ncbi:hypothetical protein D3C80_2155720 [compost metagenome]